MKREDDEDRRGVPVLLHDDGIARFGGDGIDSSQDRVARGS
jgi:hypothetical protein